MIKLITGVLLIALSLFLFGAIVQSLEIEKGATISLNLLMLKTPPGIDELNREILLAKTVGYMSGAVGVILILFGIFILNKKRKGTNTMPETDTLIKGL